MYINKFLYLKLFLFEISNKLHLIAKIIINRMYCEKNPNSVK